MTTLSRRDFVARTGTVLAAAGVPAVVLASSGAAGVDFSAGLSRETLGAMLYETFYLNAGSAGTMALQLVEIRDAPAYPSSVMTEGFALYFQGVPAPKLREGLYTLEHGSAGKLLVRLERGRMTSERALYRAQFCLLA
jgi:hypothetical protein